MQELKAQKIWVCWRYTMVKGNRTKKPFSAYGTATGTDAPHRHSWVTYDEALTASKEKHFDGIGFIIPEGYVFLDIDHRCRRISCTVIFMPTHRFPSVSPT